QMSDGAWITSDWPITSPSTVWIAKGNALVRDGQSDGAPITLTPKRIEPLALARDLYEDVPAPFDLAVAKAAGGHVAVSGPLAADLDIGAAPVLRCTVGARQGVIVVRVLDVAPDGTAIRMSTGACNLALNENGPDIAIPLQATAWCAKKGHRIALVLCADGW